MSKIIDFVKHVGVNVNYYKILFQKVAVNGPQTRKCASKNFMAISKSSWSKSERFVLHFVVTRVGKGSYLAPEKLQKVGT